MERQQERHEAESKAQQRAEIVSGTHFSHRHPLLAQAPTSRTGTHFSQRKREVGHPLLTFSPTFEWQSGVWKSGAEVVATELFFCDSGA